MGWQTVPKDYQVFDFFVPTNWLTLGNFLLLPLLSVAFLVWGYPWFARIIYKARKDAEEKMSQLRKGYLTLEVVPKTELTAAQEAIAQYKMDIMSTKHDKVHMNDEHEKALETLTESNNTLHEAREIAVQSYAEQANEKVALQNYVNAQASKSTMSLEKLSVYSQLYTLQRHEQDLLGTTERIAQLSSGDVRDRVQKELNSLSENAIDYKKRIDTLRLELTIANYPIIQAMIENQMLALFNGTNEFIDYQIYQSLPLFLEDDIEKSMTSLIDGAFIEVGEEETSYRRRKS